MPLYICSLFQGSSSPIPKRRRTSKPNKKDQDVKDLQIEVLQLQRDNAHLQRKALEKFIGMIDKVSQHPFFTM